MKSVYRLSALLVLLFKVMSSCENAGVNDFTKPVSSETEKKMNVFRAADEQSLTDGQLVENLAQLFLIMKENITSKKARLIGGNELETLQLTQNEVDLRKAIGNMGGNYETFSAASTQFQRHAKALHIRENRKELLKMLGKRITQRLLERRFSNAKTPDCAGICSQQYNIAIDSCATQLVLEVGVILAGTGWSAGMAGALAYAVATALYFNCENEALENLDTCSIQCGMI